MKIINNMMTLLKEFSLKQALILLLLTFLLIFIDQTSKIVVLNTLAISMDSIPVLPFLNFVFVLNKGVSFSFLYGLPWYVIFVLSISATIIASLFIISMFTKVSYNMITILALLLGGALGNIIDRVIHKGVVDFIYFNYKEFGFAVFNLADCMITFCAILIIKDIIIKDIRNKKIKNNKEK